MLSQTGACTMAGRPGPVDSCAAPLRIHAVFALQVRQVVLASSEATGPCKARALAQQLWDGEEFYLQARVACSVSLNCWHACHACVFMYTSVVAWATAVLHAACCLSGTAIWAIQTRCCTLCPCIACMQIDSHMRFVKGWDAKLLRMLGQVRCMRLPPAA